MEIFVEGRKQKNPYVTDRGADIDLNRNGGAQHDCAGLDDVKGLRTKALAWTRRKLAPRQHAFLQGDDKRLVYRVRSGHLRLYTTLSDGRRQIFGFKSPGDFVALETGAKYRYSAQAISAAELQSIPCTKFYAYFLADPDLLLKLYGLICADLSQAHDLVVTMGKRDAEESVANFLLGVDGRALDRTAKGEFVAMPMLHGDVADYLGLTSETVSRVFTNFKKRGLIESRGRHVVRLINRPSLKAISERNTGKPDE